jgi:hypothetical protein
VEVSYWKASGTYLRKNISELKTTTTSYIIIIMISSSNNNNNAK